MNVVKDITITLYAENPLKARNFTLEQYDWENAPDPICMSLISEESWEKVADELQRTLNDEYSNDIDDDELDGMLWREYENLVLKHCKCFYYEDMTDDEYKKYTNAKSRKKQLEILELAYERISK